MNELKKLQIIFQTLSDYNRLGIIKFICDKEYSVGEIVKETKLSQPLVSHHLKVLKENKILETKRKGPFVYYYLRDIQILYAINMLLELFEGSELKSQPKSGFCPDRIMKKYKRRL